MISGTAQRLKVIKQYFEYAAPVLIPTVIEVMSYRNTIRSFSYDDFFYFSRKLRDTSPCLFSPTLTPSRYRAHTFVPAVHYPFPLEVFAWIRIICYVIMFIFMPVILVISLIGQLGCFIRTGHLQGFLQKHQHNSEKLYADKLAGTDGSRLRARTNTVKQWDICFALMSIYQIRGSVCQMQ